MAKKSKRITIDPLVWEYGGGHVDKFENVPRLCAQLANQGWGIVAVYPEVVPGNPLDPTSREMHLTRVIAQRRRPLRVIKAEQEVRERQTALARDADHDPLTPGRPTPVEPSVE